MITVFAVLFVVGIVMTTLYLLDYLKKLEENKKWKGIVSLIAIASILMATINLYLEGDKKGIEKGALQVMRRRLNEPIISGVQLYGYTIIGKHMEKDGSDNILYFIDICDRVFTDKTLKYVKTSQEMYEKVGIGDMYWLKLITAKEVKGKNHERTEQTGCDQNSN